MPNHEHEVLNENLVLHIFPNLKKLMDDLIRFFLISQQPTEIKMKDVAMW